MDGDDGQRYGNHFEDSTRSSFDVCSRYDGIEKQLLLCLGPKIRVKLNTW